MNSNLAVRIAHRTLRYSVMCLAWLPVCDTPNAFAKLPILDSQEEIPSTEEIADLLEAEPLTLESWPTWRDRYLQWYFDRFSRTNDLFEAMREFIQAQAASNQGELPPSLQDDPTAWYLWAYAALYDSPPETNGSELADERFDRVLELDPEFVPAHIGKANVLTYKARDLPVGPPPDASRRELLEEAEQQLATALRIDERSEVLVLRGLIKMAAGEFDAAEQIFREALDFYPNSETVAAMLAFCIVSQPQYDRPRPEAIAELRQRFPDAPQLRAQYAVALFAEGHFGEAAETLNVLRAGGEDPVELLGKALVEDIQAMAELASPDFSAGMQAFQAGRYREAEDRFRQACLEQPERVEYARALGHAVLARLKGHDPNGEALDTIAPLVERFPEDGELQALYGVALAHQQRWSDAAAALRRSRELGTDLATFIHPDTVAAIETNAQPTFLDWVIRVTLGFVSVYAVIMLAMAASGTVLAWLTRGRPRRLPEIVDGKIRLSPGERILSSIYIAALLISLLFFYLGIPFVTAGVVLLTLALLAVVLMLPVISIWLLVIIGVTGLGLAAAVVRSVFAASGKEVFGLQKRRSTCPRLFNAIDEVSQRVGTDPVDDVYLAPGAEIGVFQVGRGPFGMFGVKRRVLTLGMSTLHYLTISELKSIFAHEYAHFSHADTFYSRIIHQVTMSIEQALVHMGYSLGDWNYVNPFYWFFYLYYRAYTMLSAGFSRSREYLADRMAVTMYGKTAFISGLKKVSTDGQLFEATIHNNVQHLLAEGKAFQNMYVAFRAFRDQEFSEQDREALYEQMLNQKHSLFATHPTFGQRLEAVGDYPEAPQEEPESALTLLDDASQVEEELTEFLTGAHLRWQAAMAGAR